MQNQNNPVRGKKETSASEVNAGITSQKPISSQSEVQGHSLVTTVVECPHCNALNHVIADTVDTRAFECWKCDSVFYF